MTSDIQQDNRKSPKQQHKRGGNGIIAALIGAVGAVAAAFVGGAFTGHSVGIGPNPTVTVTQTVAAKPASGKSAPASSSSGSSTLTDGTPLGAYDINLTADYSVPLGGTKPTQSQFNTSGTGDLGTSTPADMLVFGPISPDKMVALPAGSTPTYQACTTATTFSNQASSTAGTAFCLLEAGKVAGVTVTQNGSNYATLHVAVWQHASGS